MSCEAHELRAEEQRVIAGWTTSGQKRKNFTSTSRSGVVEPISMAQIEIFNHLLYLKPFNYMQTNEFWLISKESYPQIIRLLIIYIYIYI